MIKLVVGLGNPGRPYSGTRHNVGFETVDLVAKRAGISIRRRMGLALLGRARISDSEVTLAKPLTFMNLSGQAVAYICRREKIEPDEILVVYDDMALPLGRLRIRPSGSAGGHNGMKSIIGSLGTSDFPRLRIGIGSARREAVDHVLSRFRRAERPMANQAISDGADAVETVVARGLEAAMNLFNRAESAD